MNSTTTEEINKNIKKAQNRWADGIINIGKYYLEKKDYIALTDNFIEKLYSFKYDKVLFKPTKVSKKQFRRKKNEFISYFIGHNQVSDEDKGFALEPYKDVQFENFDFSVFENIIISMGNYFFTNYENEKIKVEYSFGYILDEKENELKIIFIIHQYPIVFNNQQSFLFK